MGFLLEYIKNPRRIGAVAPSGKALSRKMTEQIDFDTAKVIVEYGPGTGSFTKELAAKRRADTELILIEQNAHFCKQLRAQFGDEAHIRIIHGSAQDVNTYLRELGCGKADFILSGLPFTSLPKQLSDSILTATKTALGEDGTFITFQYSLVKRSFFEQYFRITGLLKVSRNLPPAYILIMKNTNPHLQ